MSKIVVIADDLTGAAELAGIAGLGGLSTKMTIGFPSFEEQKEEVLVINTNTRNCSPREASKVLKQGMQDLDPGKYDLLYKKTDSVLRGSVATELTTLMAITGYKNTLLVPANPDNNRTIRGGKYYLNDLPIHKTSFKNDPHFPRQSARVEALIIDNKGAVLYTENPVTELENRSRKIIMGPVTSAKELKDLTYQVVAKDVLLAGGVDFFRHLLQIKFHLAYGSYSAPVIGREPSTKKIFIWGSHPGNWEKHLKEFEAEKFCMLFMPPELVKHAGKSALWDQWMENVWKQVNSYSKIVITTPKQSFSGKHDMISITGNIAKIAQLLVLELERPAEIFVEGGETAFTLIQMLHWNTMTVNRVLAYGVVALKSPESNHEIIIKPGSYAWPS